MTTTRIVLTQPFVRHPAGTVFELHEALGVSGWDDDERVRDRQYFGDKRCYRLPDGGNGAVCELPAADTRPCPPEVFDGIDLRTGPVRITGDQVENGGNSLKYEGHLMEINGINAQGVYFPPEKLGAAIQSAELRDSLRETEMGKPAMMGETFDFSELNPGFYQLMLTLKSGIIHRVSFVKSFPLVVTFEGNSSRFQVQKTLY